jgi:hypothetical protein
LKNNSNTSSDGGAIYNKSTMSVDHSTISGNTAFQGGGIFDAGTMTVTETTISGNSTDAINGLGGGIYVQGTLTLTASTLTGNHDTWGGGAIAVEGTATVANSTLQGNSADVGGGIYVDDGNSLTITNSTLFGNTATTLTGGIHDYNGHLDFANTIIAGSTNGDCMLENNYGRGSIGTNLNNLVEDGSCSALYSGVPKLGPLQDNGGPTQTMALLSGSPAIDAGDDATCAADPVNNLDQRGITRPKGLHCDIGAFESVLVAPSVTAFSATSPSTSLNIPITTFTASGGGGVTAYLITQSATAPAAGDAGWTGTAPTTYTVLSDGSYSLYPWAKNAAGLVSAVYSSPAAVLVDTTPPLITITNPDTTPAQSKTITASASDGTLKMSNTTGTVCDGTLVFVAYASQTFTSEADNGKKVCYQAVDVPGNSAYKLSNAIAGIDRTPPVITIYDPDTTPAQSKTITASSSDANPVMGMISPSRPAAGTLSMSNTTGSVCDGSLVFVAYASQTFTSESDNGKKVCYQAVDVPGNTSYKLSNPIAGIDRTAPDITITNPDTTPALSKTITASASDGTLKMSNTTGATCDGSLVFVAYASQTFTSEADNGKKVCYQAADAPGNTAYKLSAAITGIDRTAPDITITNPDTTPALSKTITASTSDGTLTMSNTTGSVCDGSLTFIPYASQTFSSEADNGKKVCYQAVDTLGNSAYKLSAAIAGIDRTAPVITINNPDTLPAQSKTISASISDSTQALRRILPAGTAPGPLAMSNTTGSVCDDTLAFVAYASQTFTSEADNGIRVCYRAVDAAGNIAFKLSNAITGIDTAGASVTVEQAALQSDPTSASPINFTATFSEPIAILSFTAADVSLGGTASGTLAAVITQIAPNNGTTFNIAVSGMSGSGTVTASLDAGMLTDLAGNPNAASTSSDNSVTYTYNPPVTFGKLLPTRGATAQPAFLTLSWNANPSGGTYWYCYDTSNDNSCGAWFNNGTSTSVTLPGLPPNTTWYWQVKAISGSTTVFADGARAAFWSFKTAAYPGNFSKIAPARGASGQPISLTLSWGASAGASSYWYCYDTTSGCTSWVDNGTATKIALSGLLPNTTYYWQVKAVNAVDSTYANTFPGTYWSFTTGSLPGSFVKSAPTDAATGLPSKPTLKWGSSSGATSYWFCYDTTNDGACSNWTSAGTATSKNLSGLAPNTTYYWQVKALNKVGTSYADGSLAAFWSFTTGSAPGAFGKLAPANNATAQPYSLSLSWSPSDGASRYEFCYGRTNPCTNWVSVGTATSKTISYLYARSSYYWQVRAVNSFGITYADGSNTDWKFTTK